MHQFRPRLLAIFLRWRIPARARCRERRTRDIPTQTVLRGLAGGVQIHVARRRAGARSRKSMNVVRPSARRISMKPPPPILPARGCVTASANPTAIAASTALPPDFEHLQPGAGGMAFAGDHHAVACAHRLRGPHRNGSRDQQKSECAAHTPRFYYVAFSGRRELSSRPGAGSSRERALRLNRIARRSGSLLRPRPDLPAARWEGLFLRSRAPAGRALHNRRAFLRWLR